MRSAAASTRMRAASSSTSPAPASMRVAQVQLRVVVGADGRGDAALRVLRVALVDAALGEDADGAVLAREQGGVEPGDAGADDDVVEALGHGVPPPARADLVSLVH